MVWLCLRNSAAVYIVQSLLVMVRYALTWMVAWSLMMNEDGMRSTLTRVPQSNVHLPVLPLG